MNIVNCALVAAAFFVMQLALSKLVRHKLLRCIPAMLILTGFIIAFAEYRGFFGEYSIGDISGNQVVGIVIFIVMLFAIGGALLGFAAAWVTGGYNGGIKAWLERRREKEEESGEEEQ